MKAVTCMYYMMRSSYDMYIITVFIFQILHLFGHFFLHINERIR